MPVKDQSGNLDSHVRALLISEGAAERDAIRANELLRSAGMMKRRSATTLRAMNRLLLEAGHDIDDEVEVAGHLFRVMDGNEEAEAKHLGAVLPIDDEPEPDDEVGLWAHDYYQSIRTS